MIFAMICLWKPEGFGLHAHFRGTDEHLVPGHAALLATPGGARSGLVERRCEAKYAISWGSLDLVEQLEPHRPEHWGEQLINPVTSQAPVGLLNEARGARWSRITPCPSGSSSAPSSGRFS